jgi:Domain of unknown function (DUF4331)
MMSNHFSAAYLKFPGDDARLDLTDLFFFGAPASPGKTVLIMDVNPFMMGLNALPPFLLNAEFHPGAAYRVNPDSARDAFNTRHPADDAFMIRMNFLSNGQAGVSGLKPHDGLLADFPYLEPPVPYGPPGQAVPGSSAG